MTCWCGHEAGVHRSELIDFWPSGTGVVRSARRECQAQWSERGGKDRVYCNCEQYAPIHD